MEQVSGPIHLHTTVTDLDVAELTGDMTLNSDNLRVNEAKGPVRVSTRSKDIDLSQIYGDSYVETRDGRIEVEPAGAYSVEARNNKGDVEVTLPPNASASVNARTHNGDIVSDYATPATSGENKLANFTIGSGALELKLGGAQIAASGLIAALTLVNFMGIGRVAKLQNLLTATKLLVLFSFVALGFLAGRGSWGNFSLPAARTSAVPVAAQFAISLFWIYVCYSGWNAATYVAEEVEHPEKTLPMAWRRKMSWASAQNVPPLNRPRMYFCGLLNRAASRSAAS